MNTFFYFFPTFLSKILDKLQYFFNTCFDTHLPNPSAVLGDNVKLLQLRISHFKYEVILFFIVCMISSYCTF